MKYFLFIVALWSWAGWATPPNYFCYKISGWDQAYELPTPECLKVNDTKEQPLKATGETDVLCAQTAACAVIPDGKKLADLPKKTMSYEEIKEAVTKGELFQSIVMCKGKGVLDEKGRITPGAKCGDVNGCREDVFFNGIGTPAPVAASAIFEIEAKPKTKPAQGTQ